MSKEHTRVVYNLGGLPLLTIAPRTEVMGMRKREEEEHNGFILLELKQLVA